MAQMIENLAHDKGIRVIEVSHTRSHTKEEVNRYLRAMTEGGLALFAVGASQLVVKQKQATLEGPTDDVLYWLGLI